MNPLATLDKLLTFTEPAQRLARLAELRQDPGGGDDPMETHSAGNAAKRSVARATTR